MAGPEDRVPLSYRCCSLQGEEMSLRSKNKKTIITVTGASGSQRLDGRQEVQTHKERGSSYLVEPQSAQTANALNHCMTGVGTHC